MINKLNPKPCSHCIKRLQVRANSPMIHYFCHRLMASNIHKQRKWFEKSTEVVIGRILVLIFMMLISEDVSSALDDTSVEHLAVCMHASNCVRLTPG